jgi:hypothetical protein
MPIGNRLYPNGDVTQLPLQPDEVEGWLEYNRKYRPGTALFLDGVLQESGGLCPQSAIDKYREKIESRFRTGGT